MAGEADHPILDKYYCFVQVASISGDRTSALEIPEQRRRRARKQRTPLPSVAPGCISANVELARDGRSSHAQGIPFKSGACSNCLGNPPAMYINAITSTPPNPPAMNAATTH